MKGMIKRLIFVFTIELLALTMYATGHELANVKRIVFSILRARVNAAGHLVECEVKVRKPADNQPLAAEMEALLKAYHPWRVSCTICRITDTGRQAFEAYVKALRGYLKISKK